MKTIKKLIYMLSLSCAVSCSLEETPEHFVDNKHFYDTKAQCVSALNTCYNKLSGIFNYKMFFLTEIQSDLWWNDSGTVYDATLDITPSSPGHAETIWDSGYQAVMFCNECVECIAASPIADDVKMPLVAEARVLRALYYHVLTQVFNGVPFYMERVDSKEKMEEIRNMQRTPADEIRTRLYNDLRDNALPYFTEENGLKKRPSDLAEKRVGYALALYLMANFAMWNEEYEAALEPLKKLEDLYGSLHENTADYPLENLKWSIKNTPESIYELQHEWSISGVQYIGNLARFTTPKWDEGSVYDGVNPTDGGWYTSFRTNMSTSTSARATNRLALVAAKKNSQTGEKDQPERSLFHPLPIVKSGDKYEIDLNAVETGLVGGKKIDKRVYYTLGIGNLVTGQAFTQVANNSFVWSGPKFWCPDMLQGSDSNNYKLYRYADAVLMMAECYCQLGEPDLAMEYLNSTRIRAGVDPITNYTGGDDLMVQIRDERARELAGEFHRKFDLVRWGIWYDQTLQYSLKGTLRKNIRKCHRYYPIPDTQCALSGYVLKNEEYTADGM